MYGMQENNQQSYHVWQLRKHGPCACSGKRALRTTEKVDIVVSVENVVSVVKRSSWLFPLASRVGAPVIDYGIAMPVPSPHFTSPLSDYNYSLAIEPVQQIQQPYSPPPKIYGLYS